MSKALETKISELFETTKDLQSLEEIAPYCEDFNTWVNQQSYSQKSLGTLFSRYGLYSKFRTTQLQQGINADSVAKHDSEGNVTGYRLVHYVPLLCGLDNKDWAERNTTTRSIDRVTSGQPLDPEKYLEVTGKLLLSNDQHELAVGLIAATGRRPHEILARATFAVVKGKPFVVKFAGQGKKRGEKPVFEIPTLFSATHVVERLEVLRRNPGVQALLKEIQVFESITRQNVEIDKRRNGSLNRVVREYFGGKKNGEIILELRHDEGAQNNKALRAAYAALVTERDCSGSLGAKIIFASRLLGHFQGKSESDRDLIKLGTTVGYLDFVVSKPVIFPHKLETEKIKQARIHESDLESLSRLQSEQNLPNQPAVIRYLLDAQKKVTTLEEELIASQCKNNELEAQVAELAAQLEAKVIPLEHQVTKPQELKMTYSNPATFDVEAFKADFKEEILSSVNQLVSQLVQTQLEAYKQSSATLKPANRSKSKEEIDWELKSNAELWASKSSTATSEKVRRSYLALTTYNDTIATGECDRIAITNQALRGLSGVNGLFVGEWLKNHADEVISHNTKYNMQNSKDSLKLETYYNKTLGAETVGKILNLIGSQLLEKPAAEASFQDAE